MLSEESGMHMSIIQTHLKEGIQIPDSQKWKHKIFTFSPVQISENILLTALPT